MSGFIVKKREGKGEKERKEKEKEVGVGGSMVLWMAFIAPNVRMWVTKGGVRCGIRECKRTICGKEERGKRPNALMSHSSAGIRIMHWSTVVSNL